MPNQELIRLSQSHLNLLSICPPRFQQVYLDCVGSLPAPEQQENMQWGSRFHLLMQQRELTLPIESLLATDSELDSSLKALIQAAPELEPNPDIWREAEHCRTLGFGNFLFTVIYDLLIAGTNSAIILDWKTYRQPPRFKDLANNWQTRLYLYVLAETSEYTPEQIQMTYWFVKSGTPRSQTFNYTQQQHQQTEQELTILLADLETWLQDYQQSQTDLPHRSHCQQKCPYRQFLAEDNTSDIQHRKWLDSLSEIEEISI
ncbi:PD-(D/E)XK nuclease family protein [Pleurocapsales cyanobacterium LEGE 10410]|nr:PD-(D/E)XK nuclease family protein [Pleurocapsales cyanobacterium LEGE 10410]